MAALGAKVDAKLVKEIPAAELNDEITAVLADSIREALGEAGVMAPIYTPGGEDFFFYTREKPNLKAGLWGLDITVRRSRDSVLK